MTQASALTCARDTSQNNDHISEGHISISESFGSYYNCNNKYQ